MAGEISNSYGSNQYGYNPYSTTNDDFLAQQYFAQLAQQKQGEPVFQGYQQPQADTFQKSGGIGWGTGLTLGSVAGLGTGAGMYFWGSNPIQDGKVADEILNAVEANNLEQTTIDKIKKLAAQRKQEILKKSGVPDGISLKTLKAYAKSGMPSAFPQLNGILTKEQVGLGNLTNDVQVKRSEMGVANGVATLNESGQIPSTQLPSYVDDVLEYATFSSLPEAGETGKIYVTLDDNLTYRWSGTQYVEVSKSLALGETSSTAFPGDRGKTVEDRFNSLPSNIISGWSDAPVTADGNSVTLQIGGEYRASGNYDTNFSDDAILPSATTATAGVMSASDKSKLDQLTEGLSDDTPSVSEVVENINTITQNITGIQGDITDIENSIGDTSNLTTEATNLTDAINEHETQIDTISNDVFNLKNNTVKSIQVGTNEATTPVEGLVTIPNATSEADGTMSKEDKTKLDTIINTGDGTKYLADDGTYKTIDLTSLDDKYVSVNNIKTINGESIIGTGDITISAESGIEDAPSDGKQYVRQNGAWVEVSFDTTELLNRIQALEQALTLKNI